MADRPLNAFDPLAGVGALYRAFKQHTKNPVQDATDAVVDRLQANQGVDIGNGMKMDPTGISGLEGLAAGSLKSPWSKLLQVTGGENPLELSKKEWGQWLGRLGPSVRTKNAEAIGAQLADEFGTTSPDALIKQRLLKQGIGADKIPGLNIEPLDSNIAGYYSPDSNQIRINTTEVGQRVQHPEEALLGTLGHEAQHAIDYMKDPAARSKPETLIQPPLWNENLGWQGLFQPDRIETFFRAAKKDPAIMGRLPDMMQDFLKRGASPKTLAELMQENPELRSSLGGIYRTSVGNRGFRGNNQYLADMLHSKGHFSSPINGEMDLAPHHMALDEAKKGNFDIHNDWMSEPVMKALSEYRLPQVQVPEVTWPAQAVTKKAALNPWAATLAALGAGGAGYGMKQLIDHNSESNPPQQASQPSDHVLEPSPEHNPLSADDDQFQSVVNRLRAYLHR